MPFANMTEADAARNVCFARAEVGTFESAADRAPRGGRNLPSFSQ